MKRTFIIIILSVLLILLIPAISSYSTRINVNVGIGSTDDFNGIGEAIFGVVQGVGSFVSIIVLVVIGIKYMIGSAEERAEYKNSMIPYIIGAVLFFGISNIASLIYSVATQI